MRYDRPVRTEEHTCRLPLFRVPFGAIYTCPKCGKQWLGDLVEDMGGEEVSDWTAL